MKSLFRIVKETIKSIPYLGPYLSKDATLLIRNAFRGMRDVTVVQVGSNDGLREDPIHDALLKNPSWRALLVEPLPFMFERLKKNYGEDPRFTFENVAIAEAVMTKPFYYVSDEIKEALPDTPAYFDQVGSFNKSNIIHHLGAKSEKFIVEVEIPCLSLPELLARNGIKKIDMLHIDAEGYDWNVLKQLDFSTYSPRVILFEFVNLPPQDKENALEFLRKDYHLKKLDLDYFCTRITK